MCISPSKIWIDRLIRPEEITVPCRNCWSCKLNRLHDYTGRVLAEAATSAWTVTLTLTYRPCEARNHDLAHRYLTKEHFQKFIRAIRRRGHKVRYIVTGEYGEKKGRAHFHCILFGQTEKPDWPHKQRFWIDDLWPHGHVKADWSSTEKALRYICKYINKRKDEQYWFSLSKKPALGAAWFIKKAKEHIKNLIWPQGFHYTPPEGRTDRKYIMTGATRRDYLLYLHENWPGGPPSMKQYDEWMQRAMERALRDRFRREVEAEYKASTPKRKWHQFLKAFVRKKRDAQPWWRSNQVPNQARIEYNMNREFYERELTLARNALNNAIRHHNLEIRNKEQDHVTTEISPLQTAGKEISQEIKYLIASRYRDAHATSISLSEGQREATGIQRRPRGLEADFGEVRQAAEIARQVSEYY